MVSRAVPMNLYAKNERIILNIITKTSVCVCVFVYLTDRYLMIIHLL
jgi:hypothetical protein